MRNKASPPLRGRHQELARVRKLLQGAAAGTGTVVVVEGRAGLGKTALLEAYASMAAGMSFRVGLGTAEPGRSAVELEALLQALFNGDEPLLDPRDLARLQPAATETFWLLRDIHALLQEAAARAPAHMPGRPSMGGQQPRLGHAPTPQEVGDGPGGVGLGLSP